MSAPRKINKAAINAALGQDHNFWTGTRQANAIARRNLKIQQLKAGTYVTPAQAQFRTISAAEREFTFTNKHRHTQVVIRELRDTLTALDGEMMRLTYKADDAEQMDEVCTHLGALVSAIGDLRRVRRERMDAKAARIIEQAGARHGA